MFDSQHDQMKKQYHTGYDEPNNAESKQNFWIIWS